MNMMTEAQYQADMDRAEEEAAEEGYNLLASIQRTLGHLADAAQADDYGLDRLNLSDEELKMLRQVDRRLAGVLDQLINRSLTDEDYRDEIEKEMLRQESIIDKYDAQDDAIEEALYRINRTDGRVDLAENVRLLTVSYQRMAQKAGIAEHNEYCLRRQVADLKTATDALGQALSELRGEVKAEIEQVQPIENWTHKDFLDYLNQQTPPPTVGEVIANMRAEPSTNQIMVSAGDLATLAEHLVMKGDTWGASRTCQMYRTSYTWLLSREEDA